MPTYEYRCRDCDHAFEVYQSFTDDTLTECPQCGGRVKKLFGNVGIAFKGSGFYKTDSRSSGSAPVPAGTPSDGGSGAGSTTEGGSTGAESSSGRGSSGSDPASPAKAPASTPSGDSSASTKKAPATTPG